MTALGPVQHPHVPYLLLHQFLEPSKYTQAGHFVKRKTEDVAQHLKRISKRPPTRGSSGKRPCSATSRPEFVRLTPTPGKASTELYYHWLTCCHTYYLCHAEART